MHCIGGDLTYQLGGGGGGGGDKQAWTGWRQQTWGRNDWVKQALYLGNSIIIFIISFFYYHWAYRQKQYWSWISIKWNAKPGSVSALFSRRDFQLSKITPRSTFLSSSHLPGTCPIRRTCCTLLNCRDCMAGLNVMRYIKCKIIWIRFQTYNFML